MFLVILSIVALTFIFVVVIFCKRVLRKKMNNKMSIKVNEAI